MTREPHPPPAAWKRSSASGRGDGSDEGPAGREAPSAGHPVVRVTGVPVELSGLAAEFPGYEFATQQTWGGISILARRHGGCARPGLYAVVTGDPDEMRRALLEHEQTSHQGDSRRQP
jgi:hypothetical protein